MRAYLRAILLLLSALLVTPFVKAKEEQTPFVPVPVDQRSGLEKRLIDFANAFRSKDWIALYSLASDRNKILPDGKRLELGRFIRDMAGDYDARRLLKFTPVRTESYPAGLFDIYGCGAFPGQPAPVVVVVRAVREHDDWFFTTWASPDPRQACSTLSDPAWKPARNLELGFLPALVCDVNLCEQ